jgi:hypothetical protein
MGHQVNFFLTRKDLDGFLTEINRQGQIVFLADLFPSREPEVLPESWLRFGSYQRLKSYMIRKADLGLVVSQLAGASGWYPDVLRSPIIELVRSFEDDHVIRRGRVYFVSNYLQENGEKYTKSDSFVTWAKGILRALNRHFPDREGRYMIGKDTKRLMESGLSLGKV